MKERVEGFNCDKITMYTFVAIYVLGKGVSFWFSKHLTKCPRISRKANTASVGEIPSIISGTYVIAESPQLWLSACSWMGRTKTEKNIVLLGPKHSGFFISETFDFLFKKRGVSWKQLFLNIKKSRISFFWRIPFLAKLQVYSLQLY